VVGTKAANRYFANINILIYLRYCIGSIRFLGVAIWIDTGWTSIGMDRFQFGHVVNGSLLGLQCGECMNISIYIAIQYISRFFPRDRAI